MENAAEDGRVDVEACADEPIRVPGAVQPFGVLLLLRAEDLVVRQVSRNIDEVYAPGAEALLGRPVDVLFSEQDADRLRAWLASVPDRPASLFDDAIQLHETGVAVRPLAHRTRQGVLLELEWEEAVVGRSLPAVLHRAIDRMQAATAVEPLLDLTAREVRSVTGFDSVMIYKFEPNWDGKVVAQASRDGMPTFKDHHFPASDIPEQARKLYAENLSRLIADAAYVPVDLVPATVDGEATDLSFSVLRSVSPVHLEYLENMGVRASMSVSILVGDRLWGLIACHNKTPLHVPPETRTACELIGRVMAMLVSNLSALESETEAARLGDLHNDLLDAMLQEEDFAEALVRERSTMLDLARAAGAAVVRGGFARLIGDTPDRASVLAIAEWLHGRGEADPVFATRALGERFAPAQAYADKCSGLLAVSISRYDPWYVMWFRPEVISTIEWAGEPAKAVRSDDARRLHPRASFETWSQEMRGHSEPWSRAERSAAARLRASIAEVVVSRAEKLRALNESLRRLNEALLERDHEIRDIADITAHDLQEPLRKIQTFSDLLHQEVGDELPGDASLYIDRVNESAARMSEVVSALMSYLNILIADATASSVDVADQARLVVRDIRQPELPEDADVRISVSADSASIEADPRLVRRLLYEVVDNAVKFRRPDMPHEVDIMIQPVGDHEGVRIVVDDTGIGIEDAYLDAVFEPFHQLHPRDDYEGVGIGLAVSRRIARHLGGSIHAERRAEGGTRIVVDLYSL